MFRKNQRKHFLINKSLQFRYIFYIILTLTILSAVSSVCLYFGIWDSVLQEFSNESIQHRLEFSTRLREYQEARSLKESAGQITLSLIKEVELFSSREREILNQILATTYKKLIPLILALFFFIGWGSIFITHKIAGPLFRIESSLRKLCEGKLNFRVTLRKGDEGQNLAPIFNKFLENIDGTFYQLKETTRKLFALVKAQSLPTEYHDHLAQIKYELDKYEITKKVAE